MSLTIADIIYTEHTFNIKKVYTVHSTATFLTLRIPAFEAAIHKAMDQRLSAKAVIVVTAFRQLGRVLAACPVARAHGVEEEMHFPAARIRCPDAMFHLPDRRLGEQVMQKLLTRAGRYSPLVEPAGSGCVLLDIKGTERLLGDNCHVAARLVRDVFSEFRLPAVAGLAVCRPWSLLASHAAGDNGICHVAPGEEGAFLHQVPVGWVDGLTPRTRTVLLEMNIRTLGQIRGFTRVELGQLFGRGCGDTLWNILHPGEWDMVSLLAEEPLLDMDANRIRVQAALAEATVVREKLRLVVRSLTADVATSLRAKNLGAAKLRLRLLYADGALKAVECRTGGYIQEEAVLQVATERLLLQVFARRVQIIRLWLEAEKLAEPECQGVLFPPRMAEQDANAPPAIRPADAQQLLATVDRIRVRYGEEAVKPAALLRIGKKRSRSKKPGTSSPPLLLGEGA